MFVGLVWYGVIEMVIGYLSYGVLEDCMLALDINITFSHPSTLPTSILVQENQF